MAVVTEYLWQPVDVLPVLGNDNIDLTGLANGGFGAVTDYSDPAYLLMQLAESCGCLPASGFNAVTGIHGAIAQLSDGNVVVVGENGGDVSFLVTTDSGGIVSNGSFSLTDNSAVDVAALTGGGFVVVDQQLAGVDDNDIHIYIRNADGSEAYAGFAVQATGDNDVAPSVAALADGGFAVAWSDLAADTSSTGWVAVYNADGSVRAAPVAFDVTGDVNEGMSVVALQDGGFAIAYDTNVLGPGFTFYDQIALARFDADGTLRGTTFLTPDTADDTQASATVLSNGMIAVSYSELDSGVGSQQVFLQLVDPDTGALITPDPAEISFNLNPTHGGSIASVGLAGLVAGWTDETYGATLGMELQLLRSSTGDAAADTVVGDDAIDIIYGRQGSDTLSGGGNNDIIAGGAGRDTLQGGDGDDLLNGGNGNDVLDGGAGYDLANYTGASGSVHVDLNIVGQQDTLGGGLDTLISIEDVSGAAYADELVGDGSGNVLDGRGGADSLSGGGGGDFLYGDAGGDVLDGGTEDDTLNGGTGNDLLDGGDGSDTADYGWASSRVQVDLRITGADQSVGGGQGRDTLVSIENLSGSYYNDILTGDNNANTLEGWHGRDVLDGQGGDDVLIGDDGIDTMTGGAGADTFVFKEVSDTLKGAGRDVITDFEEGVDHIDLSAINATGDVTDGAFTWIDTAHFSNTAGGLRAVVVLGQTVISGDVNGDGQADFQIQLNGVHVLSATDFVL